MTNAKHTPAPWTVNTVNPHCIQIRAKKVSNPEFECSTAILGGWDTTAEENEANARLIAAAPELLEALDYIADELKRSNNQGAILDNALKKLLIARALAAISRATQS